MLQLTQTRILSVVAWYYLAFFAISMAMFGLTLVGAWFVSHSRVRHRLAEAQRDYEKRFRHTLENMELAAIAAAVIGGTSLMGGRGSVINTFFGVLIIAVLQTGLASVGASEPIKRVITGSVIVIAALLDVWRTYWQRR